MIIYIFFIFKTQTLNIQYLHSKSIKTFIIFQQISSIVPLILFLYLFQTLSRSSSPSFYLYFISHIFPPLPPIYISSFTLVGMSAYQVDCCSCRQTLPIRGNVSICIGCNHPVSVHISFNNDEVEILPGWNRK